MPSFSLTRRQVRELDRRAIEEYGVPGAVLMENAGRGAADLLISLGIHGPVVIYCGKGNNGGDGLVMARHLELRGVRVHILLFARPADLTGEAAIHYRALARTEIPIQIEANPDDVGAALTGAEWVVDALFGTGLRGPVRSPLDRVIAAINAGTARVFSVDIPSGLDCDTGNPQGETVRACHTATFVALKRGFLQPAARPWTGDVHVVDIGAPRILLETMLNQPLAH
jgi:NAD(P)H-hydrate epimerase